MRINVRLCNLFLYNLHRVYTEKQKQNDFADYVDKTGHLCYHVGTTYSCGADRLRAAVSELFSGSDERNGWKMGRQTVLIGQILRKAYESRAESNISAM